jgi:predicted subunit of tRNA(5-methylaminomethyl-2-thiouridylate) methyltransferase
MLMQLNLVIIYINVPNYAMKIIILTMVLIQVNVSKIVMGIFNIHQKMKKSAIVIAYNLQLINLLSIKDALIHAAIQKNFIMKAIRYVYLDAIMEIMHTPKMKITHLNV